MKSDNTLAVCLPAYNAERCIANAINSILSQTYINFIFIITDDCSTDGTAEVINSFNDSRIVFRRNVKNLGAIRTRNNMLDFCIENNFTYMAIMDADDIAYPDRLLKQITILDQDVSIAVCGSSMDDERTNTIWAGPKYPAQVKVECVFYNPIPTSSATIRLRYMKEHNLRWDQSFVPCADYHLWYLMLYKHNLKARNTGDIDMVYTYSPSGVSHGKGLIKQELKDAEVKQLILKHFSIQAEFDNVFSFMKVALGRSADEKDAPAFIKISQQLNQNNKKLLIIDPSELDQAIKSRVIVYLGKLQDISSSSLKRNIFESLVSGQSYFSYCVERYLMKFKNKILDRWAPGFSKKATDLYWYLKKIGTLTS